MNIKDSVHSSSQLLRAFISTGYTFKGRCTAILRKLDTAIAGSSKDILGFMFPQINPFKVLFEYKKFIIPYTFFYRKLQHTVFFFFKEQLNNFQIKMPPTATLHDDNSKTTTATIYLERLNSKQ